MIDTILLILALVCWGAAAIGYSSRFNLVAAGLFLYAIRELVSG